MTDQISLNKLTQMAQGREIHIWGARSNGHLCHQILKRIGIPVASFLDSDPALWNTSLFGRPINSSDEFIKQTNGRKVLIIIAARTYYKEISARCRAAGLIRNVDFVSFNIMEKPHYYTLEASNKCNLRCPACPAGNLPRPLKRHYLSVEDGVKVMEKIRREDPAAFNVDLFDWGEPTLNPQLTEIIQELTSRDFYANISTNLNTRIDLTALVKSRITYMFVSASGFGPSYEQTHKGGRWSTFTKNLIALAEERNLHNPNLNINLVYHLYKYEGQSDDYRRMRDLCRRLNIHFQPRIAFIAPYDAVAGAAAGRPLSSNYQMVDQRLLISLKDILPILEKRKNLACQFENVITIDSSLAVKRCCVWHHHDHNHLAPDFLSFPLTRIIEDKKDNPLCRQCLSLGLHSYATIIRRDTFAQIAAGEPLLTRYLTMLDGGPLDGD